MVLLSFSVPEGFVFHETSIVYSSTCELNQEARIGYYYDPTDISFGETLPMDQFTQAYKNIFASR